LTLLIDAIRAAYLKEIVNRERDLRNKQLAQLYTMRDKREGTLRDKRQELRDKAEALGSRDSKTLAMQRQLIVTALNSLQSQYLTVQADLRRAELELTDLMRVAAGGATFSANPLTVAVSLGNAKPAAEDMISADVLKEIFAKDAILRQHLDKIKR